MKKALTHNSAISYAFYPSEKSQGNIGIIDIYGHAFMGVMLLGSVSTVLEVASDLRQIYYTFMMTWSFFST